MERGALLSRVQATRALEDNLGVGMTRSKRVHQGKAKIARDIATGCSYFVVFDDGKCRIDVGDIFAVGQPVELEEDRVELRLKLRTALSVWLSLGDWRVGNF